MQDRILAQAVDPHRKSLGRALHRYEVVDARLRRRRLDPALAHLEAIRPLEKRERRAGLVRERTRAGLAENAQPMVAGAVTGGGLTVIANAPNPAGFAILKDSFEDGAIGALGLAAAATLPTLVAIAAFQLLPG